MLRVALINAPLLSAVCDHGVGHQMPLGLLMIGGPLADHGCQVRLVDAACDHLSDAEIVDRLWQFQPDVVMIAHVGSTQTHPTCLRVLRAVKAAMPQAVTVYGGVHPTYHYKTILAEHPEVDLIVRGEGEAATLELVRTLAAQLPMNGGQADNLSELDLSDVRGIAWRRQEQVVANPSHPTIEDLDSWRIGWELIEDWDKYQAFGMGRAAVVQFSRGCPHACTYCGQWMFWKRWRYRDVMKFVDELEFLRHERDVRFFWLADENPTTDKATWKAVLEEIARRNLGTQMCASIRAADLVRDADILHLYREAGFLYVLMGIETVTDETLGRIRKRSSVDDGYESVRLLRKHGILSIVDYIFGLEEETPGTIWRGLKGLNRYDGDFVNALYITPHAWTPLGHQLKEMPIVEPDLWKWDYRHQIVAVKRLSPTQLLLWVKLVELIYHLHPKRLWRILASPDRHIRRHLRHAYWHISKVFIAELMERLRDRYSKSWIATRGSRGTTGSMGQSTSRSKSSSTIAPRSAVSR